MGEELLHKVYVNKLGRRRREELTSHARFLALPVWQAVNLPAYQSLPLPQPAPCRSLAFEKAEAFADGVMPDGRSRLVLVPPPRPLLRKIFGIQCYEISERAVLWDLLVCLWGSAAVIRGDETRSRVELVSATQKDTPNATYDYSHWEGLAMTIEPGAREPALLPLRCPSLREVNK